MPLLNGGNRGFRPFLPAANAEEVIKVNSINFDNSDSIIFLGTSDSQDLANIKIKKNTLNNPDRVFFDIENAVITFPNTSYEIKNSKISKLRIAQNSIDPKVVRIVIWKAKNYDISQIKVLKIKNNIIIKLNNDKPIQQYLTQVYKETKQSASDYYEKAIAIPEEKAKESDEIYNKVQQAFKQDDRQLVRPNIEQKQAKLKSRFFLEKALVRNGSLLLSGIGVVNVEKAFTLTEPSRIVFDLPNTIVVQELRDKEIKLSDTATAKIGQFEPSKARIVIKTDNPDSYKTVYSSNLQTIYITNSNNLPSVSFLSTKSELKYFKEQNANTTTDVINITFSEPIVYAIQRENTKLNVIFYNLTNFNITSFNEVAKKSNNGIEAKLIGSNIYKISFPVANNVLVDGYEALNGSQLRFVFTKKLEVITPKAETTKVEQVMPKSKKQENVLPELKKLEKTQTSKTTKFSPAAIEKIKNKVIVIDPGHGGNDTGAQRNNVLEKDLTLSIALKVRKCLQDMGMKNVIMTRPTDKTMTLDERVRISNTNKADIYVSIHINASVKSEVKGVETHYYKDAGYDVAKVIHKELMKNVDSTDRGLFKSKFYVINHTEAPSVLLELGFISNDQERNALNSEKRQTDSAKAIADGIINYLLEH
jgi:N-acetylmuramoyl-L-alanine amidase